MALLLAAVAAHAQHNHGASPGAGRDAQPPAYVPKESLPEQPIRVIQIDVTARGFEPATVTVRKGERVRLVVTRRTDDTCAREIVLDEFLIWRRLPLGEPVSDTFTTGRAGEFPFRCASGQMAGVFKVEE